MLSIDWEKLRLDDIDQIVSVVDKIIKDDDLMIRWVIRKVDDRFRLKIGG